MPLHAPAARASTARARGVFHPQFKHEVPGNSKTAMQILGKLPSRRVVTVDVEETDTVGAFARKVFDQLRELKAHPSSLTGYLPCAHSDNGHKALCPLSRHV